MDTTLNPKPADPRHVLIARADEEISHAYEQITSAGEDIARAEEQLSKLEHAARRAAEGKRPSLRGRRAVRGVIGLMLAACIGVAAFAWQSPNGDAARQIIAGWAPRLVLTSWLPLERPGLPAQPGPPAVQTAAKTAPPQPAALAQAAPEDVAPTAAALSPELTLLQSMARDLATLGQAIEQLKASQQQMARDHVNAVDLLRVSQEQMARVIAKTSEAKTSEAKTSEAKGAEQNLRPRTSAPPPRPTTALPPRPTAAPTRKPVPTQ
jgi:hypothetical protein